MNARRRGLSTIPGAGWRHWGRRAVVVFVVALAALGTVIGSSSSSSTTGTSASSVPDGLFVSSQNPADVLALGKQLGVTPSVMTVYADGSCYCTYTDPPSTSMTLMLGVGALSPSEATSIGQSLVAAGQSNAIIRIMWEQNQDVGGWFPTWNQFALSATQYIATFQSVVTTMRSVPGQAFRFMWNPNGGTGNEASGRTWDDTWPGSSYVNFVGVDQYDYAGYSANIQAVVAFAQSQGLPAAIPEWGLNGSDDPSYINGVANLVGNTSDAIAVQAYFSYDGGSGGIDSDITQFPQSEAAFKADFGGIPSTIPSTTTTTTSPPTTIPSTTTTTSPPTTIPPPQPTVTTVTLMPATDVSGQVLTATVSPAPDGGTVTFSVDGQPLTGAEPVGTEGTATRSLDLSVGAHTVIATYSGNADFESSTVDTVLTGGQTPTTLTPAAPDLSETGQQYLLSVTVTSAGTPLEGAWVSFTALGSPLCQTRTDATGSATCSVDAGAPDGASLATTGYTVIFDGDPLHLPNSSHSPIFGRSHWGGRGESPGTTSRRDGPPDSHADGAPDQSRPEQASAAGDHDATAELAITNTSSIKGSRSSGLAWLLVVLGMICVAIALGRRLKVWRGPRTMSRRGPH